MIDRLNSRFSATHLIVFANVIVHVVLHLGLLLMGGFAALQAAFGVLGLSPAAFWSGAVWQPFTSLFVHGSFLHLLVNMIGIWSLGGLLERSLGRGRYLWLYLISGLTGSLFVILFQGDPNVPNVGASGALAGLLAALALRDPEARLLVFFFPVRARTAAIGFAVFSLLFSLVGDGGGISHLGHLGGLVGGFVYARFALGQISGSGASRFGGPRVQEQTLVYDPWTRRFYVVHSGRR